MTLIFNTFFHHSKKHCASFVATSLSLGLLTGCATMSVHDCQSANWSQLGKADGAKGRLPDYIYSRAGNCIKNGIQPNIKAWEIGRKTGLVDYCTAVNAATIGRRGGAISPVCGFLSAQQQQQLHQAHERGFQVYERNQKIERLKAQISDNDRRIRDHKDERDRLLKEKRDFNSGLEYSQLNDKIKRLQEQNDELRFKLARF